MFYKKFLDINWWLLQFDKLLKHPNVENGFIPYEPTGTDEIHFRGKDFVLGNTKPVLREDGQWIKFRPEGENQISNRGSDKMACVSFSSANAIETIINYYWHLTQENKATEEQKEIVKIFIHFGLLKKIGEKYEANVSDRYIAKTSGTTYRGNTQSRVADAIRHFGLVPEEVWGWVDDWNEYYKAIPDKIIERGKELMEYIDINYEWASPALLKDSLKYASLQTSGHAWNGKNGEIFIRTSSAINHAFVRDGYSPTWIDAFDSYMPFHKKLANDFNFGWDMLYSIHLKRPLGMYNIREIQALRKRGFRFVMRTEKEKGGRGEIYELLEDSIRELTTHDKLYEAVRTLAEKKDLTGISEELFSKIMTP